MREILFKGFHECENGNTVITINGEIKHGVWVEGLIARIGEMGTSNIIEKQFDILTPVKTETICQYTGLTDKNGKRIFENDIVLCNRYDDENYQVVISDIWNLPREMFGSNLNWREVIGNIFENPVLLESEDK